MILNSDLNYHWKKFLILAASCLYEGADGAGLVVKRRLLTVWLSRFPEKYNFTSSNFISTETIKSKNHSKDWYIYH